MLTEHPSLQFILIECWTPETMWFISTLMAVNVKIVLQVLSWNDASLIKRASLFFADTASQPVVEMGKCSRREEEISLFFLIDFLNLLTTIVDLLCPLTVYQQTIVAVFRWLWLVFSPFLLFNELSQGLPASWNCRCLILPQANTFYIIELWDGVTSKSVSGNMKLRALEFCFNAEI